MMLVEGSGLVVPAPVSVRLTPGDVEMVTRIAREREQRRKYGDRPDQWGRGLLAPKVGSPTFFGLIGELGFVKYMNSTGCSLSLDTKPRRLGDGGQDFDLEGIRVQMKTRVVSPRNLIRRVDHHGVQRALTCQAYVFAAYDRDDRRVDLLGWIHVKDVLRVGTTATGKGGAHQNIAVADRHLEPVSRLAMDAEMRRALRRVG